MMTPEVMSGDDGDVDVELEDEGDECGFRANEAERVNAWRTERALNQGYDEATAATIADSYADDGWPVDLHRIDALVERGSSLATAWDIVR